MLCKGVDPDGVVFYTNLGSDKSHDLQANPWAAVTFPWIGLQRQVHVRGPVERVSDETGPGSTGRPGPRGSRLGAWASPQSTVVPDRAALEALQDQMVQRFGGPDAGDESAATLVPLPDSGAAGGSCRRRWSSGRAGWPGCTTGCATGRDGAGGWVDRTACPVTAVTRTDTARRTPDRDHGFREAGVRPAESRAGARIGPDTRPLGIPAYRRLFLGQVTTVIGAMLTTVAVQQQIFDITGSSAWVGFASLVALVPLVVFGLLGGAIADTYDRRKLLMITSVGIALTSIGLWIAALIGRESVWVVLALLAVQQGVLRGQPADPQRDHPADRAGRHGAGGERAGHDGVQHRGHRRAAAGRDADPDRRAGLAVLHRRAHAGRDPVRGDQAAADPAAGRAPRPGEGARRHRSICGSSRCC